MHIFDYKISTFSRGGGGRNWGGGPKENLLQGEPEFEVTPLVVEYYVYVNL